MAAIGPPVSRGKVQCSPFPGTRGRSSRVGVSVFAFLCAILLSPAALAQRWLTDGIIGLSTGFEGADLSDGISWQRARLRLNAGFDLAIDESVYHAWGARAFVELERSAGVGAELRYIRWISPEFGGYLGAVGVITPETLLGGEVGATYLIDLSEKTSIYVEGMFAALPLGSDRPNGGTVLWALLGAGLRVEL